VLAIPVKQSTLQLDAVCKLQLEPVVVADAVFLTSHPVFVTQLVLHLGVIVPVGVGQTVLQLDAVLTLQLELDELEDEDEAEELVDDSVEEAVELEVASNVELCSEVLDCPVDVSD
jgi:hypothetical protein